MYITQISSSYLNLKFQVTYIGKMLCSLEQQVADTFFFLHFRQPRPLSPPLFIWFKAKNEKTNLQKPKLDSVLNLVFSFLVF